MSINFALTVWSLRFQRSILAHPSLRESFIIIIIIISRSSNVIPLPINSFRGQSYKEQLLQATSRS